jgi:hypothetical protein
MISELLEALNAGHLLAEVITEIVSYLVFGVLIGRWMLRRHDKKVHPDVALREAFYKVTPDAPTLTKKQFLEAIKKLEVNDALDRLGERIERGVP